MQKFMQHFAKMMDSPEASAEFSADAVDRARFDNGEDVAIEASDGAPIYNGTCHELAVIIQFVALALL